MELPNPAEFIVPVRAGLADFAVSRDPQAVLCAGPLGAGLGVSVYDPLAGAGGLLHTLLPDSRLDPSRAAQQPGMFVDTGLAALLQQVQKLGARREEMVVCVAGGGRILEEGADFDIGGQNHAALETWLAGLGLKIHAAAVAGQASRILRLNLATGQVRVRLAGGEKDIILCQP
jgi:chemotaxis protein CheD